MSASGFNKKCDNILVFSNTKKHTTGVISGIGNGYTFGAPDSPWILVEFVLLNL
jgi:hypothetical protein